MIRFFPLLLLPACLLSQHAAIQRERPAEPAIEFTTTSNASQVGTSFVLGFQFSVQSPVILNSLGAVLRGSSAQPVFGTLPLSMPVGLWDDSRNLLVSATVSGSDPLIGHFNYAPVANTLLLPGVSYTIAGLVPAGRSVLSDVPDTVTGSTIVYGGARSLASNTLAYPAMDTIGLRNNYFGAGFTYTGGASPVARPGRDRAVATGAPVKLDGSASFSTSGSLLTWKWALISVPPGSAAALSETDSATPSLIPDSEGVYVARLIVDDGSIQSRPSSVSMTARAPMAATTGASKKDVSRKDAWTKSGASDSLRQAFERTLYSVRASGHGVFFCLNRAQQLTVQFDAAAAHLSHPDGSIGVHLTGYGYGGRLEKPASAPPVATANRVEYRRGDLTEWYMNTPQGLEQGFTLARRPAFTQRAARRGSEPMTIALRITGDLAPEQRDGAVLLRSGKGVVMRYAGLTARDARGHALPSRLEVAGREIRLVVEDGEAQYPLAIDPTWTQQAELTASNGLSDDNFGTSVAVSGTIAVIGSFYHSVGSHAFQGAAYVFVQSGTTWSQQAELTSSGGTANDNFGNGVSVSGGTAVIGAPGHNNSQGAAYVFVKSGTTWSQQAELTSSDGAANDNFGAAVSVDGGTAVIGAYEKASRQGAAYVFVQSGTTWAQQAELTASDGATGDAFGNAVSVSGGTAAIGAFFRNTGQGAAYIFVQSGTTWAQQQELTASDGAASDQFGHSVSVDGATALVGAYRHTVASNSHQGAAYVFVQSGTTWSQQQELTASDGAASDLFGWSVAVSGSTAVVGADARNSYTGAAYIYTQSGTTWTQQQELTASDGAAGDYFGWAVAVVGGTVISSAYFHTVDSDTYQGAAYVFTIPASLSLTAKQNPIFQAGPGVIILDVANAGGTTAAAATVSDTIDPAFTIDNLTPGCTVSGQTVTCTVPAGAPSGAFPFPFGIFMTASPTAAASIANTITLTDSVDAITTPTYAETINVSPEAPLVDSSLSQLVLSGSTDNGPCAMGNMKLTATDLLQNTSASTLTNPYAVIATLSGGNTLLTQAASATSVAAGDTVTFSFHIQLASCNRFQLFFDVHSN